MIAPHNLDRKIAPSNIGIKSILQRQQNCHHVRTIALPNHGRAELWEIGIFTAMRAVPNTSI